MALRRCSEVVLRPAGRRLQAGSGPPAALPQQAVPETSQNAVLLALRFCFLQAAAGLANTTNVNGTQPALDCSHEEL